MKANHRKAYNALKRLGVPVFERNDHPDGFFISAEHAESYKWVDYWNEYSRFPDFGVNSKIREVLKPLELFAEWENPACLGVYEI